MSNISIKELVAKGQYTLYSSLTEKLTFFIFFVYLARKTSIENYGTVVAIFAFSNILSYLFEFGFAPYFQRESSVDNRKLNEEIQAAISFKLYTFPFFLTAIIIYSFFSYSNDLLIILVIGTTIFLLSINSIFTSILYGKNLYSYSFYALFSSRIFIIFLIFLFLYLYPDLRIVLLALLSGSILQSYFLLKYLKTQNINTAPGKVRKEVLKKIMSSSLPIGIGISFVFIYDKVDILIIEKIINPEAVAYYAVAYSLYKLPQLAVSVVLVPLFSDFSNIFQNKNRFSLNLLIKPATIILIFSLFMIIGINYTSGLLLKYLYGIKYLKSAWILNMLCFALPGLFLNGLTGITLNSLRKEKLVMYSGFSSMVINITVNLYLLDKVGIEGAIIATIAAEYANFFIQFILLAKIRMFSIKQLTVIDKN